MWVIKRWSGVNVGHKKVGWCEGWSLKGGMV